MPDARSGESKKSCIACSVLFSVIPRYRLAMSGLAPVKAVKVSTASSMLRSCWLESNGGGFVVRNGVVARLVLKK